MPLNSFFPTKKRILNFTFLLTLCALTAYFIPSRYQLANLAKPAVLPTVTDQTPTKDKDQPTPTLSAVLGEQNSNQNQSQTDQTQQFIEIKGNLGTLGQLIQKNGKFYLAKNVITNENIQWHTIRDNDLANNSVTSRIIKDHSIQSEDLADNITIETLNIDKKLDFGKNSISEGKMRGNWEFGSGNLTTTGNITAQTMNITGATNFTGNTTFDGTVTLGSLMPKTAGALTSNVTTNLVSFASYIYDYYMDSDHWVIIGTDGFVDTLYVDFSTGWGPDLHFIHCLDENCTTKNDTIINPGATAEPDFLQMTKGPDGFARIIYNSDYTDLHYIVCADADCNPATPGFSDMAVVTNSDLYEQSLAIASDGTGRIAYADNNTSPKKVFFVKCSNISCSSSTTVTIDNYDSTSVVSNSIMLDENDIPSVIYSNNSNQIKFARCSDASCSSVVTSIIVTGDVYYVSSQLGNDGFARASYESKTSGLYYLVCNDANCSAPVITLVDSSVKDEQSSMILGNDGYGRIVRTNPEIYYQCLNDTCSSKNIASIGTSGYPTSIALGNDGFGRIVWTGSGNTPLKMTRLISDSGEAVSGGINIGSAVSPFGNIYGSNINTSQLQIQGNSTNPFSIKNALGNSLFSVDGGGNINAAGGITASSLSLTGNTRLNTFYERTIPNISSAPADYNKYYEIGTFADSNSLGGIFTIDLTFEGSGFGQGARYVIPTSYDGDFLSQYASGLTTTHGVWIVAEGNVQTPRHVLNSATNWELQYKSLTNSIAFRLVIKGSNGQSMSATAKVKIYPSDDSASVTYTENTGTGTDATVYERLPSIISAPIGRTLIQNTLNVMGRVGIGTTSPSQALDVANGNIVTTGRIGIGTTAPSYPLHVSTTSANIAGYFQNYKISGDSYAGYFQNSLNAGAGNSYGAYILNNSTNSGVGYGLYIAGLAASTNYGVYQAGAGDKNYFAGNVGIGTTNPSSKLEIVSGSVGGSIGLLKIVAGNNVPNDVAGIAFSTRGQNADRLPKAAFYFRDAGTTWGRGDLVFAVDSSSDSNPISTDDAKMIILNSGNVGIGTTAPTQKLTVAGNINVVGGSFIDDGTTLNVPDYVFEPGYNLKSIPDLETYINQNLHLPNVPSQDQIKKTGMNYGSMLMTLLEKTEENTLYTIDNYHQITGLTDKNVSLDDKLNIISQNLTNLNTKTQDFASLQAQVIAQTKDISALTDQMKLLQDQTKAVIDFQLAFNLDKAVLKDSLGNITLLEGKITAKDIEVLNTFKAKDIEATNSLVTAKLQTGTLTVDNENSGKAKIKTGDTSVTIETPQASEDVKIYITKEGSSFGKDVYYENVIAGKSFDVKFDGDPVAKDINFNWLIVK